MLCFICAVNIITLKTFVQVNNKTARDTRIKPKVAQKNSTKKLCTLKNNCISDRTDC